MRRLRDPIVPPAVLTADGVGIRAIRPSDARTLEALLRENRAWLERWEATPPGGGGPLPSATSMRPVIRSLRRWQRAGLSVPFVIFSDGEVVGQLSVSEISGGALRSAQIGYWVAERVAGRGVTPVAVALAIDYLFEALGLHRVEICIRPENIASLRVVEKLGMRHEGRRARYIHIDGDWRDHESFALTREDAPRGVLARLRQGNP